MIVKSTWTKIWLRLNCTTTVGIENLETYMLHIFSDKPSPKDKPQERINSRDFLILTMFGYKKGRFTIRCKTLNEKEFILECKASDEETAIKWVDHLSVASMSAWHRLKKTPKVSFFDQILESNNIDACMQVLEKGLVCFKYVMLGDSQKSSGPTTQADLKSSGDNTSITSSQVEKQIALLVWEKDGRGGKFRFTSLFEERIDPRESMDVDLITNIKIGRRNRAFFSPAAHLVEDPHCMSMLSSQHSIDFELANSSQIHFVVMAVIHLLGRKW